MLMVINMAPLVKMVLVSRSFTVSMSVVEVPQLPVKLIRLPPPASRMRFGSVFYGR